MRAERVYRLMRKDTIKVTSVLCDNSELYSLFYTVIIKLIENVLTTNDAVAVWGPAEDISQCHNRRIHVRSKFIGLP